MISSLRIPDAIRIEIATEYGALSENTINYFLDIAAEQFPKTKIHRVKNLEPHNQKTVDGLRIMCAGRIGPANVPNWICIKYNSYTKKLHVYENVDISTIHKSNVQPIQEHIINVMFPKKEGPISYDDSITPKAEPESSGLYAIIYATTLLMDEDPTTIKFQMNDMYGDQGLYMRLNILKIFANRRLTSLKRHL